MSLETNNDLTKLAAQFAPEFKFSGPAEIVGASASHAHLFSNAVESAKALTETAGKAFIGGAGAGLASGTPLIGLAVGGAIAVHTILSGSKKDSPHR